ncbi:MAG TPA: elongation factor P [Chloroflexota bacterium]|nr:elongation factor P [Chloroflexota bacterium]
MQITTSDFRKGIYILFRDEPYQIAELEFVNPGKGSAFFRTKLRSMKTGRTIEYTFKSGESVAQYEVITQELQYLYRDGDHLIFMDPTTFNQFTAESQVLGPIVDFLRENDTYAVMLHGDEVVGIRAPKRVVLTVTEAEPAIRGNTATGLTKSVVLDNGVSVTAPSFIEIGDTIAVNPDTREYIERANA